MVDTSSVGLRGTPSLGFLLMQEFGLDYRLFFWNPGLLHWLYLHLFNVSIMAGCLACAFLLTLRSPWGIEFWWGSWAFGFSSPQEQRHSFLRAQHTDWIWYHWANVHWVPARSRHCAMQVETWEMASRGGNLVTVSDMGTPVGRSMAVSCSDGLHVPTLPVFS